MPACIPETVSPYIRHRALPQKIKAYNWWITPEGWHERFMSSGMINIQFIVSRRRGLRDRGKSAFLQYRAVYQQGNRNPDCSAGYAGHPAVIQSESLAMSRVCRRRLITLRSRCRYSPSEKIRGADISLGPEMKSTGECLGIAKTFNEALYKAFLGAGI